MLPFAFSDAMKESNLIQLTFCVDAQNSASEFCQNMSGSDYRLTKILI